MQYILSAAFLLEATSVSHTQNCEQSPAEFLLGRLSGDVQWLQGEEELLRASFASGKYRTAVTTSKNKKRFQQPSCPTWNPLSLWRGGTLWRYLRRYSIWQGQTLSLGSSRTQVNTFENKTGISLKLILFKTMLVIISCYACDVHV